MANANIELTVNVERVCNEALFEFADNFYKKTGLRLQRVEFDWMALHALGDKPNYLLRDVYVATSGGAK